MTPGATPTPTMTPTPGPTVTPTPGPTATPGPEPTATPAPGVGGAVLGEAEEVKGEVLGYAATSGGFVDWMTVMTGWAMMGSGVVMYARKKQ
jgi:hypothetical protein